MRSSCKYVLFIFALIAAALFSGCGVTEYSVKDFAVVSVIGYTEHGTLQIKVNDEAVNRIYADGQKDKTAALRFAGTFKFSYEGQNEADSYFSNGDVVTINVTYDESLARDLGITFTDSSFQYTVEGLEDKASVSPFDGLSVKFSGVAPYGTVQLDKSNCIQYVIDNVTFYCDNHDLSNGDKVVVRAEYNSEIAERNGFIFTEDAKKYTVVGLSKYVTTMMGVSYTSVTAKMRYMVEQHVAGTETAYKSFEWYFGEDNSDSDSDGYIDEDLTESSAAEPEAEEEAFAEDGDDENGVSADETSSGSTSSGKKKKQKTDIQKLKEDFVLSEFDAKFEYKPIKCFYGLNPLQYSDNIFYSVYRVKGTFKCKETSGSGYLQVGDTVVGEIYLTASLASGSVDIKSNLVYENSVLDNPHAYSIKSYPKLEDVDNDILISNTYLVETLSYIEDTDEYDKFVNEQETKGTRSRAEVSHITIASESDSDKKKKKRSSAEEETSSEIEEDTDPEESSYLESAADSDGFVYEVDDGGDDENEYEYYDSYDEEEDYENYYD